MKPADQILNTQEREALRTPTAPDGLWPRIEQLALLESPMESAEEVSLTPILGGASRFSSRFRFAAAGMLGFLAFIGLQQAVMRQANKPVTTSIAASGLHVVDHLRQDVPLIHNPASYVDGLQDSTPWPEVTLATFISTHEAN